MTPAERSRAWRLANKNRYSSYKREYRKRDYVKEYNAKFLSNWRLENKEHIKEYEKESYKRNPEKFAVKNSKRRAQLKNVLNTLSEKEWKSVLEFYGRCLWCGRTDVKLTLDHIKPISLGGTHTLENVQPLCGNCNSKKGVKTIDFRLECILP